MGDFQMEATRHAVSQLQGLVASEIVDLLEEIAAKPGVKEMLVNRWRHEGETVRATNQAHLLSAPLTDTDSIGSLSSWNAPPGHFSMSDLSMSANDDSTAVVRMHPQFPAVMLRIALLLMIVTVTCTYILSIRGHRVDIRHFFISTSIDIGWAHRWGALGISVGFTALLFVVLTRFLAVYAAGKNLSADLSSTVHMYNKVALSNAVVAVFGAMGVAAFNVGFNKIAHFSFAFLTFGGFLLCCAAHSRIDAILLRNAMCPRPSRVLVYFRHVLCLGGVLGLSGMVIFLIVDDLPKAALSELFMTSCVFDYFLTWMAPRGGFVVDLTILVTHAPRS